MAGDAPGAKGGRPEGLLAAAAVGAALSALLMLPLACWEASASAAAVPLSALLLLACAAALPNADGIALVARLMVLLLPASAAGVALVALLMLARRECGDATSIAAAWQLLSSVPLSS